MLVLMGMGQTGIIAAPAVAAAAVKKSRRVVVMKLYPSVTSESE